MKRKKVQGTSAVEFAIILPLLIILVFAIIEFGLILYNKAVLTNASREGARVGIVRGLNQQRVDDATIRETVKLYCQDRLITFGNDSVTDQNITISPGGDRSGLARGTPLEVNVSFRYDFLVLPNFLENLFPRLINLEARTVMKLE